MSLIGNTVYDVKELCRQSRALQSANPRLTVEKLRNSKFTNATLNCH